MTITVSNNIDLIMRTAGFAKHEVSFLFVIIYIFENYYPIPVSITKH
jgi:hypothetical protein